MEEIATRKQLWALFCITKKDHRNLGLTKTQASEMLDKLMKDRPKLDIPVIMKEAIEAGKKAAQIQLNKLEHAGPQFNVIDADFFTGEQKMNGKNLNPDGTQKKSWQMLDVCGFAWIEMKHSSFVNALKKAGIHECSLLRYENNHKPCVNCNWKGEGWRLSKGYNSGFNLSLTISNRQEMSVNEEGYRAAAEVLNKYGANCHLISRID